MERTHLKHGLRRSRMSGISRLWRPSEGQASSPGYPDTPGKTFVVPLFLSTTRSSARNNMLNSRTVPPASSRSRSSTCSVIESPPWSAGGIRPLSVGLDARTESSDMYGSSVLEGNNVNYGHAATAPALQNPSYPVLSSERSSRRSERGSSRSSHSSRRHARRHAILSRTTFRDPRVNSKARISFAFGITLLTALVICECSPARSLLSCSLGLTCFLRRSGARGDGCCAKHHVSCPVDSVDPGTHRGLLSPTDPHVHADATTATSSPWGRQQIQPWTRQRSAIDTVSSSVKHSGGRR